MAAIRKLIQDRFDARVVGFYIISKNTREIERFVKNNIFYKTIEQLRSCANETLEKLKGDKHCVINMPGYDDFYLLTTTKIQEHDIDNVNADMSATAIAKNLSKMMNSRKVSRVVLERFINVIS